MVQLFTALSRRCVQWYIAEKHWYAVPIAQGVITLFVLINFSMATFMDPGATPRRHSPLLTVQASFPEPVLTRTGMTTSVLPSTGM